MLGAIRRVISGDALDGNNNDNHMDSNANSGVTNQGPHPTSSPTTDYAITTATTTTTTTDNNNNNNNNNPHPTAVVVEHDREQESGDYDAPFHLIRSGNPSNRSASDDNFTANSSLSDDASAGRDEDAAAAAVVIDAAVAAMNSSSTSSSRNEPAVDVYMEDVVGAMEGTPTPLAGVGSGPQQHTFQNMEMSSASYQMQAEHHRSMVLGNTTPTAYSDGNQHHHHYHQQQHHQQQQQQQYQTETASSRMQRMESSSEDSGSARGTTVSANSSRDWGWFDDDVHLSGHLTPSGSRGILRSSSLGNRSGTPRTPPSHRMNVGLDPRDDHEAFVMAVTAPTYVLEESRSSQRLWKDSAGRRPPQPVEERAFYEQMWSQNFAKSQVNYQMPAEVLTATTPISLSPFAEGGAMEVSPAADAAEGGNYQYNMNVQGPTDTHNMMMMPSSGVNGDGADGDDTNRTGGGLKEAPRQAPPSVLPPTHHQHIINKTAKTDDGEEMRILVRGDNVFGTTVSKSFALSDEKRGPITNVVTVNISIASYRVVESRKRGKYAQFLVIYREGSIRDTIGVWKRYSDFDDLARTVTQAHEGCASVIANISPLAVTEEHDVEHLPNAITSWRLLKKRQRWYRCLDSGYLSLKVFLLERFLHDILFESSSPKLLREFVGGADGR